METWATLFEQFWATSAGQALRSKIDLAYQTEQVFPPKAEVFKAFELTPLNQVRVVIIGQDPYHDENQANGLAFSVNKGVALPPSLRNIYKELAQDLQISVNRSGDLSDWAKQGVLLLNTSLTVIAHQANSHAKIGWQNLTDLVIQVLNQQERPIIFVLWGKYAQSKKSFITNPQHIIIESAHPSPLSAHRGFFGSRPFSKINQQLKNNAIKWQ